MDSHQLRTSSILHLLDMGAMVKFGGVIWTAMGRDVLLPQELAEIESSTHNIATRVSLSSLVLNYDKCGFLVELYHCRSGEDFEVDEAGNLLFNDDVITAPRRATSKSASTASVASALSGLLKPKFPGVPFSVVG